MHNPFGVARGAAGVDQLGDCIGCDTVLAQDGRGVALLLPRGLLQQRLKTVGTRTTNRHHLLQMRQLRLDAFEHGLIVHAAKLFEHDHDFGFAMAQHEEQFALAEDWHQRVQHSANTRASQVQHREMPHIGQLARHHIGRPHAQPPQAYRHAVSHAAQLGIAKAARRRIARALAHQRQLVWRLLHGLVQRIVDCGVLPPPLCHHLRPARRQQYGIKLHVCLLVGSGRSAHVSALGSWCG